MKIHTYEMTFLGVGVLLTVGCLGALLYATTARGIHLPGHGGTIDPRQVDQTPPFDQPGVRQTANGEYEVVMVARAWSFTPNEVRVPAGSRVTFVATSTDVIHGLLVGGTRINVMLIPGQITRYSYTFDKPGEYLLMCHEYCGLGHHTMGGKVVVE
jgi:cytochrome c oxidase subunit 2